MLVVNREIENELYLHALSRYPSECCGILLGKREGEKKTAQKVIKAENKSGAERRATHFIIDPLEIAMAELAAERERLEIIGFYHSHPNYEAIASKEDELYMITGYSYPIISVKDGRGTRIACFEKSTQASDESKKEKIIIQGE